MDLPTFLARLRETKGPWVLEDAWGDQVIRCDGRCPIEVVAEWEEGYALEGAAELDLDELLANQIMAAADSETFDPDLRRHLLRCTVEREQANNE